MIRTVRLERIPTGLRFPEELAEKISFDAARQELQFKGFMSKTDFDKLVRLHNDLNYQRSLEKLFQMCTYAAAKASASQTGDAQRRLPLVFAGVATVAATAAAILFLLLH
jgi:DNA topoisomerase IB